MARVLKRKNPNLKVFAVEPLDSPVISGGNPSPHPIQGVRTLAVHTFGIGSIACGR